MAIRLLASFMVMAIVSHVSADLPLDRYWNSALPNTPMPNSLHHLLTTDFTDEKSTNVQVGKGGVNVYTGKGKGTAVNVGKGGVHVDTGKGKGTAVNVGKGGVHVDTGKGSGTHVSVGSGKGHGGGVAVHTGKPGKRTDVGVGKGGVIVRTRHKGRPVYVGVRPGPNPFVYNYAASETQLHDDPNAALFFLEKDLVSGKSMNVRFNAEDGYGGKTAFLPRGESVPFGSEKFSEILSTFSVRPGSEEAEMMKKTIDECEAKRVSGEEKYCATSLESMVDFSVSKLETLRCGEKQGNLVLLRNLDPTYSSKEVENIVYSALNEHCTARLIERTAATIPHIGEALVLFKTSDAAARAIRRLNEGGLLLSNGRVLVTSNANLNSSEPPLQFTGHIKPRARTRQNIKTNAVAPSHSSEANTIEYEGGMEWCLHRDRYELSWKRIFERQTEEMKKLHINMKRKNA